MKRINTSPISGTAEFLPETQAIYNNLKQKIAEVYHLSGYQEIETPHIERTEILLAKAGGDTEKQIYKLVKTKESAESSDQALRFDHTVPLARYIVEHENNLVFPFKAAQLGVSFRGERAQKGRFREFCQCDIDIIGRGKLELSYDADVIATIIQAITALNLGTPVLARISNRKILTGLIESLGLTDKSAEIFSIIDHSEKVTPEQTKFSLEELQLDKSIVKTILDFISINGDRTSTIAALNTFDVDNQTFTDGVNELDQILYLLESAGLDNQICADMKIVRGLDYYTGTVFEVILPEHKNIGSVAGGGRYENLTKYFSDNSFPGVGGSIGFTRLFYVLNENHLLPDQSVALLDYAIIPITEQESDEAFRVAARLRANKRSATIVLTDKKLGDRISYATKLAKSGIVIGEEEVATKILKAKDFTTGEVSELNLEVISDPTDFWGN